ncbi:hypothetical protein NX059_009073 [Plenodomus lindquistii]|nr:hypothetical protein NX059_009073 [Plenodomus lindquistii]
MADIPGIIPGLDVSVLVTGTSPPEYDERRYRDYATNPFKDNEHNTETKYIEVEAGQPSSIRLSCDVALLTQYCIKAVFLIDGTEVGSRTFTHVSNDGVVIVDSTVGHKRQSFTGQKFRFANLDTNGPPKENNRDLNKFVKHVGTITIQIYKVRDPRPRPHAKKIIVSAPKLPAYVAIPKGSLKDASVSLRAR